MVLASIRRRGLLCCGRAIVVRRPRLPGGNGGSSISGELADWPADESMDHARGAPRHPQTRGKIERRQALLPKSCDGRGFPFPGRSYALFFVS